ncbi:MAG: hypothetical protein IMW99_03720 [Firmicutes bacterium]|nr:hypothetical protein [Bacillota bacterium]
MAAKPILLPYQQRWIEDKSPLKIVLKARQIGFSFALAFEGVMEAIEAPCNVLMLSASLRQSRELMEKVYQHLRALNILAGDVIERPRENAEEVAVSIGGGHHSRIICLPASPDTVRGFSGHIFLDEFAFHRDDRAIWRAIYPTVTRGYKLRIASTPNGKQNLYYELWRHGKGFSRHKVDIYDAKAQGLPVDIDTLRDGISDPDAWAQEYECQFLDEATAFLTFEMIDGCEDPNASVSGNVLGPYDYYLGVDVGRKHDLTVLWAVAVNGAIMTTRLVHVLERAPFREQREVLFSILPHVRRACIDATGIGAQLAEECQEAFGTYRVEAVTFTGTVKESLAIALRRRFEDRLIRIPAQREIRDDLHSVRKVTTAAGNIRFDAERTDDGHADRFWALALAVHAASSPYQKTEYISVQRRRVAVRGAW